MKFHKARVTAGGICLLIARAAFGQAAPALAADHPEVYSSFCFFAEDFGAWLDARGNAVPAKRTKLMESAARYLGVDANDLPKVIAACRTVSANVRRISADAQRYREGESAAQRAPDATVMGQFKAQHDAAVQAGVDQLRQTLSTPAWSKLRTYINGAHRNSIKALTATTPGIATTARP